MIIGAIALGLVGLLLIYLEFFLPGGILAIGGGTLLLASLVLFFMQQSTWSAILYFVVLVLLTILVCQLALWHIKMTGKKKTFFLDKDQEGYQASAFDKALIGKVAEATSDLKPSGHISVEGQPWQAVSESGYIHKGSKVLITGGEGAHLVVKLHKG